MPILFPSPNPARPRRGAGRLALIGVAVALLAGGCALRGPGAPPAPPFSGRQLTAVDLDRAHGARDLLDAIARLRPQFLRGWRSSDRSPPAVYVNGVPAPGIEVLREIRLEEVQLVRLLEASEATLRYGSLAGGSILEVTTRGAGG